MKLSKLIEKLEQLKDKYGDLPVFMSDAEWGWDYPIKQVSYSPEREGSHVQPLVEPDLPNRISFTDSDNFRYKNDH